MTLTDVTSAELHARVAEVAVQDALAASAIARLFHEMHAAMGECRCHGPWPTANHALEYAVMQSANVSAKALLTRITAIRRGILVRRQITTKAKIELQRRSA